jgi:hypothetical protein
VFSDLIAEIQRLHPDVTEILFVTHFAKAEFSTIEDGRDMLLGGDFIYSSKSISGKLSINGIEVNLYDTYLLTSMSLEKVGKLLGIEKIDIGEYRSNKIIDLYRSDRELFRRYALNDAKITAIAFKRIQEIAQEIGLERLPKTVGGIGAAILAKKMKDNPGETKNLGYYTESNKTFKNGKTRRSKTLKTKKGIEENFSGILYGGRNEVYMRGYIPDCTAFDYDLRSAYGTAQTTIGQFDFSNPIIFRSASECFTYLTENPFSFGRVYAEKWRHKPECQYPVLIHKVNDAGVFTRETEQYWMSSFEFLAAYNSFSEITGFYGVIYPRIYPTSVISEFQSDIRDRRNMARGRDQFKEKLMKIISNSTYGKFCQGYSGKNTLNLKKSRKDDLVTGVIPKSQISNPFIAAYITSLVRAIAFETLNYLQDNLSIRALYWTTDGFAVTQPVPDEIMEGDFGIVSRAVADHVERIMGKREIYEKKHTGKGWLSIKTRAYTMLEPVGDDPMLSSVTGVQFKGSTDKKAKFIESEFQKLERFQDTKYLQRRITSMLE